MSTLNFDVVVVGGGPVGAATALGLSRRGFTVALVERGVPPATFADDFYDPRVYAIAPRSAGFLQSLEAWQAIAVRRLSAYSSMKVWQRDPSRTLSFEAGDAGAAQLGWIIEHGLITDALWAQLSEVRVFTETTITSAEFGDQGTRLTLAGGRILQARLAVAADGAQSALRAMAGIEVSGWQYAQRAIVCHISTEKPHRATAWQRFLSTGPLAFLPLADGRASIVWSAEAALADELMGLDEAAFCARLTDASENVLGTVTAATSRTSFPLALHQANEYARPGLALAGDAAHGIHPLAGQGVNLGFADAQALIAVLTDARAADQDWSSLRALARYARARKAANLEMQAITDLLYRAFRSRVPGFKTALGLGLGLVNEVAPLRGLLARRAAGL